MAHKQEEAISKAQNLDLGLDEKGIEPAQIPSSVPSRATSEQDDPDRDPFLVTFTSPLSSSPHHGNLNPKHWTPLQKWLATGILSVTGFNRILVSTIMAPALPTIANELHMSPTTSVMSLSVYLLATAFGPLLIGPLSEMYGRRPVLHATNTWFLVWNLACGFASSSGVLLAARLLAGLGASAIYTLGGGVLGDVWRPEERGRSLGLYQLIPLLGSSVGPILGGLIAAHASWRWMFWATTIFQAVATIASVALFRETYPPAILRREARRLRQSTGDERYHAPSEKTVANRSLGYIWGKSLSRPLRMLLFHGIVQIQAVVCGFAYGITYLVISSYAAMWTTRYGASTSAAGLHYLAMCTGEILGSQLGGPAMDIVYGKLKKRRSGEGAPEFHVPLMLPGCIITVAGFLLYGWSAQTRSDWVVVDLGALLLSFGNTLTGQVLTAYVIDAYRDHTSSALAASQLVRSLTAFGFPLFAPRLYEVLGYGWGNTLLAFVSAGISLPAAVVLWTCGGRLREGIGETF